MTMTGTAWRHAMAVLVAVFAALVMLKPGVAAESSTAYTLGTGDKLKITVFGEDGLTGEYEIDGDGIIEPNEWLKTCPGFDVAAWLASHGNIPEALVLEAPAG